MAHNEEIVIDDSEKDFGHNWVSSSRFLFLCQVFLFIALVAGCSYGLYKHSYKKTEIVAPENTLYNPKYK